MKYSNEQLLTLYERMVLSRVYEELVIELLAMGKIQGGAWHLAIGQEAAQVGCLSALGPNDYFGPTHRCHGVLASKLDINKYTAECLCKGTGYQRGKAAIVHISSMEDKVFPANGILGAGAPIAVGFAVALKRQKKDGVVVSVIGDGASNEGNFYEAINLAAIMEAPVVFFIDNNGIGFTNPISNATRVQDLSAKGAAVGIPGITVDGNDVLAVREAVEAAIERAREGQPSIVEAKSVRFRPHAEGLSAETRDPEMVEEAKKNDPIKRYEKVLKDLGILNDSMISEIYDRMKKLSMDAFEYGFASNYPSKEETCDLSLVYKTLGGDLA
ncbi:MAG TPA: thiamine pyrophosphate-dependent dehydrogenase E1 component subunit alpha [Tissierellia bacterium]|nr:thiamine pyrophosphate-dependent dehydrogenase E1 component subunit alpha [Tissierellia bacterium]